MASPKSPLGLPPLTPELKPIVPFLQRAEEVKATEPVVAYWCAYYAAQLGIGLKTKDATSRNVLVGLLGYLEQVKSEIGANDAVQTEAVGSAYVENFGLKVFTAADNEDRAGRASRRVEMLTPSGLLLTPDSRSTAKKFLAAANFLEALKTFGNADVSESNIEKIKYAKWKATDIAKAFREGRKPAPGPPGWAEEQEVASQLTQLEPGPSGLHRLPLPSAPTQPASSVRVSPERSSSPRTRSKSPTNDSAKATSTSAHYNDGDWSTIAAPNTSVLDFAPPSAPSQPPHRRSSGRSSPKRAPGSPKRGASVSDEMEGKRPPSPTSSLPKSRSPSPPNARGSKSSSPTRHAARTPSPGSDKKVHFSPSVVGGSFTTESISQPGSPNPVLYSHPAPPAPVPPAPHSRVESRRFTPPRLTQPLPNSAPPPSASRAPVVLTPAIILQAQKFCKLASSALDYEDAETAKAELRAALRLLGD